MDGIHSTSSYNDPAHLPPRDDDWISDPDSDEDDDESNDSDIDAEAEEIARRLGEQLWALNNAAGTGTNDAAQPPPHGQETTGVQTNEQTYPADQTHTSTKGEEAALATVKTILALLENDPPAKALLSSTALPGLAVNVLDVLRQSATMKSVAKAVLMPLSQALVELARSEQLFGDLRLSNAPAIQLDLGKRKRDEMEDQADPNARLAKRPFIPEDDLQSQVMDAVRVISQALSSAPAAALDPNLVSSIQIPLHQVFLFAVTSSARGGPAMHALQEISGLVQVIGVLSGIQIGQPPHPPSHPYGPAPGHPWPPGPHVAPDIGTAVYPCHIPGCCKIFSRLYSLRAHQRNHAVHRPYRCTICPASFARNHDLKRHIRLHDRKAWKCGACQKIFSRRDAFKRHKDGSRARGMRSEDCTTADVIEVELDEEDANDVLREERRAKLWTGLAHTHAVGMNQPHRDSMIMEDGEIPETMIQIIQGSVLGLHGLLQAHVGNALGVPPSHGGLPAPPMVDAAGSQATLASVIARAQSQAMPIPVPIEHAGGQDEAMDIQAHGEAEAPQSGVSPAVSETNQQDPTSNGTSLTPLSMYGLSDEQTKLLELAIANAASLAQAQAEAEAALEEEDEEDSDRDDEDDEEVVDQPADSQSATAV